MSNHHVIALVGDLVKSREIPNRVTFDKRLLEKMRHRSKKNHNILSPYTLIGDEIQAVYKRAEMIFEDCMNILEEIYPERMRFSFGVGELIKPINPTHAIEMDGPAFYCARDGINELKKSGYIFNICGRSIPSLEISKQSLFYISHTIGSWNKTRFQVLPLLFDGISVKEIAPKIGKSRRTVYKTIDAGALKIIIKIFKEIEVNINGGL